MAKDPVKVEENLPATEEVNPYARPDWMKGQKRGSEDLKAHQIEIPRLLLMQGVSPQVMEQRAKQGDFYHNINEIVVPAPFRIVVLLTRFRYILWPPRVQQSSPVRSFLARADDGIHWEPPNTKFDITLKGGKKVVWETKNTVEESGLGKFGSSDPEDKNSVPAASETQVIFACAPDYPELGVFTIMLQRVFLKAGRKLNAKLSLNPEDDTFARYYEVSAYVATNERNEKYYDWRFGMLPYVHDQQEYKQYEMLYEKFAKMENIIIRGEDAFDQEFETDLDVRGVLRPTSSKQEGLDEKTEY